MNKYDKALKQAIRDYIKTRLEDGDDDCDILDDLHDITSKETDRYCDANPIHLRYLKHL